MVSCVSSSLTFILRPLWNGTRPLVHYYIPSSLSLGAQEKEGEKERGSRTLLFRLFCLFPSMPFYCLINLGEKDSSETITVQLSPLCLFSLFLGFCLSLSLPPISLFLALPLLHHLVISLVDSSQANMREDVEIGWRKDLWTKVRVEMDECEKRKRRERMKEGEWKKEKEEESTRNVMLERNRCWWIDL